MKTRYCVDEIVSPTADIRLITLKPLGQSLPFSSGQYIEALLPDGNRLPLSIANTPNSEGKLVFHIRLYPNTLAIHFVETLIAQKQITLMGPYGEATLNRLTYPKTLFLAGGVGFAPIQGLLTELLETAKTQSYHLFWGIKQLKDCYAMDLLRAWKQQHTNFDFTIAISDPHLDPDWAGERGLIHQCLMKHYPELSHFDVVACGPQAMIDVAYTTFQAHGLKQNSFISDAPVPIESAIP